MSDELKEIPQPGSIIRYAAWNGVVLDVFQSETSDKHILQIMFAKNIYKQQPAELHIYEDLRSSLLFPSTREALLEELAHLNKTAFAEADKLLEKAISPAEIPIPTGTEAQKKIHCSIPVKAPAKIAGAIHFPESASFSFSRSFAQATRMS